MSLIEHSADYNSARIWWSTCRAVTPTFLRGLLAEKSRYRYAAAYQYLLDDAPEQLAEWAELDPESFKIAQEAHDIVPISWYGYFNPRYYLLRKGRHSKRVAWMVYGYFTGIYLGLLPLLVYLTRDISNPAILLGMALFISLGVMWILAGPVFIAETHFPED